MLRTMRDDGLRFVFLPPMRAPLRRRWTNGEGIVDVVVGSAEAITARQLERDGRAPQLAIVVGEGFVPGVVSVVVETPRAAVRACAILVSLLQGGDRTPQGRHGIDALDLASILRVPAASTRRACLLRHHAATYVEGARAAARALGGRPLSDVLMTLSSSSHDHPLTDANEGLQLMVDDDDDDLNIIVGLAFMRRTPRVARIELCAVFGPGA